MSEKLSAAAPSSKSPGETSSSTTRRSLGWFPWVGIVIAILFWLMQVTVPTVLGMVPLTFMFFMMGPYIALLLMTIWWLVYKFREKELVHAFVVIGTLILGAVLVKFFGHASMGLPLMFFARR